MSSNSFGNIFKISSFGESHGHSIGCVIDGVPSGLRVDIDRIQKALDRRKPGQSALTTSRSESDRVELISGTDKNMVCLGGPLCFLVKNSDARTHDYADIQHVYRPSHADFSYHKKYGVVAQSGGGRASARETIARVIGGALAMQVLEHFGCKPIFSTFVCSVFDICMQTEDETKIYSHDYIDTFPTRCPNEVLDRRITELILEMKKQGDSVGGIVACNISKLPMGIGEPVFDKLNAVISHGVMSIPACKGIAFGQGINATKMRASEHNDQLTGFAEDGSLKTTTNHSGGIQGGISTGQDIHVKAYFKAPSTIKMIQNSLTHDGKKVEIAAPEHSRHDPCVLPRAVPIVEAMVQIAVCDLFLRQRALTR